jgi:hypothetical protein
MPDFPPRNADRSRTLRGVRSYGPVEWQSSYYRCYFGGMAAFVGLRYIADSSRFNNPG